MQTETVTRLRPGSLDSRYSPDPKPSWDVEPTPLVMETLAPAEPGPSTEPTQDARGSVVSSWKLYLAEDADVLAGDRMIVRGTAYDVDGTPASWLGAGLVVSVKWIEDLVRAAGVQRDMDDRAERVLAAARAGAPVDTGAYKAGLHVETTNDGGRRIAGSSDHDIYVEADTGNLSRSLDAAGGS